MANGGAGKGANPPFATADGKPTSPEKGGKGGRDFTQENRGQKEGNSKSFNSNDGGGRDFTSESRPQGALKNYPGLPNTDNIPSGQGGKILQADPAKRDSARGGNAAGSAHKPVAAGPFKNLKGG